MGTGHRPASAGAGRRGGVLLVAWSVAAVALPGCPGDVDAPDGGGWIVETVDEDRRAGLDTDLVLTDDGVVLLSYAATAAQGAGHDIVRLATLDGGAWTMAEVAADAWAGWGTSLAIDGAGAAHVAYVANPGELGDAAVASDAGGGWATETVDAEGWGGKYPSLAIGPDGARHLTFFEEWMDQGEGGNLRHATDASGAWAVELLDDGERTGAYTSLVVDGGGHLHVAYCDLDGGRLVYGTDASGAWAAETVDGGGYLGLYASLALDGDGHAHVAYYDARPERIDLRYATDAGGAWAAETVDADGWVGAYASLALDADGAPVISYYDQDRGAAKIARRSGAGWAIEVIEEEGQDRPTGTHTSLALAPDGRLRVAYHGGEQGGLRYAVEAD